MVEVMQSLAAVETTCCMKHRRRLTRTFTGSYLLTYLLTYLLSLTVLRVVLVTYHAVPNILRVVVVLVGKLMRSKVVLTRPLCLTWVYVRLDCISAVVIHECCYCSEMNADVIDDIVSCTEDDCNNDSLMRTAITGIGIVHLSSSSCVTGIGIVHLSSSSCVTGIGIVHLSSSSCVCD